MKNNEAAKPPAIVQTTPGKGKEADSDEAVLPAAPPKTGILPTGLSRAMVIGSVLLVLTVGTVGLFGNRFMLIPSTRSENGIVYRLDRLNGRVSFCSPAACVAIPDKSEAAD